MCNVDGSFVHSGQDLSHAIFDDGVKFADKSPGGIVVDSIQVVKVLDLWLFAVAKVGEEPADMIGQDVFSMLFAGAGQLEHFDDLVCLIAAGLYRISVRV